MNDRVICEECGFDWSEATGDLAKTFNACGKCGAFLTHTKRIINSYFDLMNVNNRLSNAVRLAMKSETPSAVREATITLETVVRKKSKLNAIGAKLMDRAFSFEYDRKNNSITRPPVIQLNNLSTETKRNEQDGMRLLTMGIMRGVRNIFAHSSGTSKFYYCLNIITTIDMLLQQIIGYDGTIAEDRTFFEIHVPKEHEKHNYRELGSSSGEGISRFYCETCAIEFTAKREVIINKN